MTLRLKVVFVVLFSLSSVLSYGQGVVEGVVTDAITGESLIGVNIVYEAGKGVITDIDGNYRIDLENGSYTLTISYVGYITQTSDVTINNNTIPLYISLKTVKLLATWHVHVKRLWLLVQ